MNNKEVLGLFIIIWIACVIGVIFSLNKSDHVTVTYTKNVTIQTPTPEQCAVWREIATLGQLVDPIFVKCITEK
jgi:hypothetical protein